MPVTIDSLFLQAMNLPEEERAILADKLLDTVDEKENLNAWEQEAERRLEQLERGDIKEIPLEEVLDSLKKKYPECLS